ncbi:hypothetical protein [[Phormidium ambiguum] IAM M-71]|nr:hypothetical protein [Phormidium ambiguum]
MPTIIAIAYNDSTVGESDHEHPLQLIYYSALSSNPDIYKRF